METTSEHVINIQEGSIQKILNALEQYFTGTNSGNIYDFRKGSSHIHLAYYNILEEFELFLLRVVFENSTLVKRLPDNRADIFYLTLIKEGKIYMQYQNQQQYAEAGSSLGIFLHNGLFTLDSSYSPQMNLRSVNIKFSKAAMEKIIPEAIPLLSYLFADNEPKAYHTHISPEVENMIDDLFFYENVDFGSKALVIGRGLELYTLLMSLIKKRLEAKDLHGLHVDDYNRLLEIKNYVLNNLDQKVNMDAICLQFGISISKLKRDFKTLFDCSLGQFYTHARMDEAYRRLKTGKYSVMEVGYDMGYQNLSKFSQMFKKVKGINPNEVIPV
ncbi:helix-turn-helix domain-containing protein [Maribellus sediminis]|uniref:helix-turn-helix domain-containing protein n=1 Tax=Maribellus sediminis TaxID=2696285 RepID=UPI00142FAE21|nr:AraC family transcriptional regulator [Maribellus sediminis]